MVTPSLCYVFNISLSCENSIPSFIGNLWRLLLVGNYLKCMMTRQYQTAAYPQNSGDRLYFLYLPSSLNLSAIMSCLQTDFTMFFSLESNMVLTLNSKNECERFMFMLAAENGHKDVLVSCINESSLITPKEKRVESLSQ